MDTKTKLAGKEKGLLLCSLAAILFILLNLFSVHAASSEKPEPGLVGEYFRMTEVLDDFPTTQPGQKPNLQRIDASIDFIYSNKGFADTPLKNHFFARWNGQLKIPRTGDYRFFTGPTNNTRVFIDGERIAGSSDIKLAAGMHALRFEYFHTIGRCNCWLSWQPPNADQEIVPAQALFHEKINLDADAIAWREFTPPEIEVIFQAPPRRGDICIAGDWDGNGTFTPGIVRGTDWLLWNSNTGGPPDISFNYGEPGDLPVVGDWDGNKTFTPGVVRHEDGKSVWYLRNSNSAGKPNITLQLGDDQSKPVAGDWNGDKKWGIGIVTGNIWQLCNSTATGQVDSKFSYGRKGDKFVTGDWDGDGVYTAGVFRQGAWYLRNAQRGGLAETNFVFNQGDKPVAGDWFGNGKTLPGVVSGESWFVWKAK